MFTPSPENDMRGIDLVPYVVDFNNRNADHQDGGDESPLEYCLDEWRATSDHDENWHCTREPGHDGLHLAFSAIPAMHNRRVFMTPLVNAIWGDEGTVFPL